MLQDEGDLGTSSGEAGCVGHLRRKDLEIETPAVIGKLGNVALDGSIVAEIRACSKTIQRIVVPVQLHAHTAHKRIARETVELRTDVFDGKVGISDDRVRPAVLVGG